MNSAKQITKSVAILSIFSLCGKILGFVRELLIAAKFGSGIVTDTFFVALTATSLMTSLIGAALSTTLIPVLSEIESKEGKKGKNEHVNNILNIVFILSASLTVIGWILAPILIRILALGFESEQLILGTRLIRIGMPVVLFSGTVYVFKSYLENELMFRESAVVNLSFNFIYIFYLIFLSEKFQIEGLMVTSVLAVAFQVIVQMFYLRETEFKYKFIFELKDKYIKKTLLLIGPIFIGTATHELNIIIDKAIGSGLLSGSISALNYASKLNNIIMGIFITTITTVIFPMLSKEISINNIEGFKKIIGYGFNITLLITIPSIVGLIVLSNPIVEVAFQRGAFDSTATMMTASALRCYSLGLLAFSLRLLINRVYYSLQDTKTPMYNGIIYLGINTLLSLLLSKLMGHNGIALATSIASTVTIILLIYCLWKKIGYLDIKSYIKCGLKSVIASVIMGVVVHFVYYGLYSVLGVSKLFNLVSLLIAVIVGVMFYFVLCYLLKVKEIETIFEILKRKLIYK